MPDDNHRSNPRTRTFLKGQAIFNNRNSTLDCVVRNVSSTGAKLQLTETVTLPDVFDLSIPQKGETVRVRLRWRHGEEVGVSFVSPLATEAPAAQDVQERLRELELENARLRQLLAEMKGVSPVDLLKSGSGG
jgi:hypothetical protein